MTPPDSAAVPLVVRGLSVVRGDRRVVQDADLDVHRGELVTVLGGNGSGKSSLVRACLRLLPVAGGTVELFGTRHTSFRQWQRVGYVPQSSGATSGVPATVREVVASGRLSRRPFAGFASRADRDAVRSALDQVGLSDRGRDPVSSLSGGQQRRVMIARALASSPELLVMDEPTAGVDADQQQALASVLADLLPAGLAVLLVAHELGPLEPLVDRCVVMRDGRAETSAEPHSHDEVHGDVPGDHHHPDDEAGSGVVPPSGAWRA